jgi:uncharacterized protein with PQ loop repeat
MRRDAMTMLPADGQAVARPSVLPPVTALERVLRFLSVLTMLMTVPQVFTVWFASSVGGVSLLSWTAYLISACLWFVYGLQKKDKTIYLACIGWILLDAAIVLGVIIRG